MHRSLNSRLNKLAKVACTVLVLGYGTTATAVLYDDFDNRDFLDSALWTRDSNFSHFVENGRLRVEQRRADRSGSDNIRLVDSTINAIQATVNVQENSVTNVNGPVHGRVRMFGTFCDLDGMANGFTGEVFAEINLGRRDGGPLVVNIIISRCDNEDCTAFEDGIFDINNPTLGPAFFNTDHDISVAFDDVANIFTFGFDGNTASFGSADFLPGVDIPLANCGPSNLDFEAIGTRIGEVTGPPNQDETIIAFFDDIVVNGASYDDFSQGFLDPSLWRQEDLERAIIIDNNAVRLEQRRGEAPDRSNSLNFTSPDAMNSIRTDIQIVGTEITGNGDVRARIAGSFFNDGASTGPNDLTGDVFAQLSLIRTPSLTQGIVFCSVIRSDDPNFNTITTIFNDTLGTWVGGMFHNIVLGFDPNTNTFVCEFDGQRVTYTLQASDPQPVDPAIDSFKNLSTRITGLGDPGSLGFISAVFDNVEVNVLGGDASAQIPTLSQWAMLLVAVILVISAGWTLRRRA